MHTEVHTNGSYSMAMYLSYMPICICNMHMYMYTSKGLVNNEAVHTYVAC